MIIKQGNKEFVEVQSCIGTVYYVSSIDGKNTTGRQSSYMYFKCPVCEKIIGTQFNGYKRHRKTHEEKK